MIHATIPGRLGNDAQLRRTQSGTPVLNFPLATDSGVGEKRSTSWVDCALFGRRAESLAPHLKKGSAITAFGELVQRQFQRKDGTEGYGLALRVVELELQGNGRADGIQTSGTAAEAHSHEAPF